MATYNKLINNYKDQLDELSSEDAMGILESLIKQMYDAYNVYDIDNMNKYHEELEDAMAVLEKKFTNIRLYVWRTKFYYESSLHQYKMRKSVLRDSFHNLESYIHVYGQVESSYIHLRSILNTYYLNYSNSEIDSITGHLLIEHDMDDVCDKGIDKELWDNYGVNYFLMGSLDRLIADIRDSILYAMDIIEEKYYSSNDSHELLDKSISGVRDHVHELIEEDFYRYQREKGIVDVELGWINVFQIEYELNKAYKDLKKEIEEMFDGDNGFNHIHQMFYDDALKYTPNLENKNDKYLPKYNIMETTFIPPESRKDEKMWEKYYWWKSQM